MSDALRRVMSNGNLKPNGSIPMPEKPARSRKRGRPGPKKKVEDDVILSLLRQGYSQSDIARHVNLSPQAISKRMKTLGHRAIGAMFHADSQLWGVELKTMTQLAELNSRLMKIAQGKESKTEEVVTAAREIRRQLEFQMRFQDALKVQQRFEEFRETVLMVLDDLGQELGMDIREKVMDSFRKRTNTRLMLTAPRAAEGKGRDYKVPGADPELLAKVVGPSKDIQDAEFSAEEEEVEEVEEVEVQEIPVAPVPVQVSSAAPESEEDGEDDEEEDGVDFDL